MTKRARRRIRRWAVTGVLAWALALAVPAARAQEGYVELPPEPPWSAAVSSAPSPVTSAPITARYRNFYVANFTIATITVPTYFDCDGERESTDLREEDDPDGLEVAVEKVTATDTATTYAVNVTAWRNAAQVTITLAEVSCGAARLSLPLSVAVPELDALLSQTLDLACIPVVAGQRARCGVRYVAVGPGTQRADITPVTVTMEQQLPGGRGWTRLGQGALKPDEYVEFRTRTVGRTPIRVRASAPGLATQVVKTPMRTPMALSVSPPAPGDQVRYLNVRAPSRLAGTCSTVFARSVNAPMRGGLARFPFVVPAGFVGQFRLVVTCQGRGWSAQESGILSLP